MNCDIVLRDETCAFAVTPAKLGLPYNVSGIQHFVNRLPLNIVKEMFFSADPITAVRVEQVGIVNRLVAAKKLEQATRALAATIASRSPHANAAFREQVRLLCDTGALSPPTYEYIQSLRHAVYCGTDYHEGIRAFLEAEAAVLVCEVHRTGAPVAAVLYNDRTFKVCQFNNFIRISR
jgi:methylmalonyl-CoA decarboxylase